MMKTSEIIQGVMDLLSVPEHWTRCAVARSIPDGTDRYAEWSDYNYDEAFAFQVEALDKQAQSWCLGGAVCKVMNDNSWHNIPEDIMVLFQRLAIDRGHSHFVPFNNSNQTTHEDLMLFLKEALYEAEIREAHEAITANISGLEGIE